MSKITKIVSFFLFFLISLIHCGAYDFGEIPEWNFIVVGDSRGDKNGVNIAVLTQLVDAIIDEPGIEFVLFPGDLVDGESTAARLEKELLYWKSVFYTPLQDAGIKVFPVRGNHEKCLTGQKANNKIWTEIFGYLLPQNGPEGEEGMSYTFEHKNAMFVAIDTYAAGYSTSKANLPWLKEQLKKKSAPHLFVFAHEMLYKLNGSRHSDNFSVHKKERDELINLTAANGGRAFFCCHDHYYDHAVIKHGKMDFHQLIVGTAGADKDFGPVGNIYAEPNVIQSKHEDTTNGYAVVSVNGAQVKIRFKKKEGQQYILVDEFGYELK